MVTCSRSRGETKWRRRNNEIKNNGPFYSGASEDTDMPVFEDRYVGQIGMLIDKEPISNAVIVSTGGQNRYAGSA